MVGGEQCKCKEKINYNQVARLLAEGADVWRWKTVGTITTCTRSQGRRPRVREPIAMCLKHAEAPPSSISPHYDWNGVKGEEAGGERGEAGELHWNGMTTTR